MNKISAPHALKKHIIKEIGLVCEDFIIPSPLETEEQIDNAYGGYDDDNFEDYRYEIEDELRQGECETNIEPDWSRHYESKSVAAQTEDGWIGWTYWFGGGKHGQPEAEEWIDDAYYLDCKEEEKTVTIRTFKRSE